jgi:hypothetical protein
MKLYRIALLLFLSAITSATQAQKSELSLEDIWANRQFFASGLPEVRAMKDGKHFSELVNSATGT